MMKGFVNINKPLDMTSSDVVIIVRGILRRATGEKQKTGHLGTLDPMASGVLPVAVGNATRLFDYLQAKTKVYQATFKFGIETDTLDSAGKVTRTRDIIPSKEQLVCALAKYKGDISQIPPLYSAKSVGGKRAYDLARAGVEVELQPKVVHIDCVELIDDVDGVVALQNGSKTLDNGEFAVQITCGGGTYIRAIARDIAAMLNTVGYMSSLNRIKTGEFCIESAVDLKEFEQNPLDYVQNIDDAVKSFESFDLPTDVADKVLNGVRMSFDNLPKGDFVVRFNGEVVGMACEIDGKLAIRTRL